MPSSAVSGVGTTFGRADTQATSEPTFTSISEINSIVGPNKSRSTFDVTSLDSTGGYREFKPGFRDGGEVTLGMNFTIAGYDTMNDDFEDDSSREYRITFPNTEATTMDFDAYVTSLGIGTPLDDKITADVTLKITGQVRIDT